MINSHKFTKRVVLLWQYFSACVCKFCQRRSKWTLNCQKERIEKSLNFKQSILFLSVLLICLILFRPLSLVYCMEWFPFRHTAPSIICTHAHTLTHIRTHNYTRTATHAHTHMHTNICIHTHMFKHAHTHVHTHTHTHRLSNAFICLLWRVSLRSVLQMPRYVHSLYFQVYMSSFRVVVHIQVYTSSLSSYKVYNPSLHRHVFIGEPFFCASLPL